jgi:hypothetical protein
MATKPPPLSLAKRTDDPLDKLLIPAPAPEYDPIDSKEARRERKIERKLKDVETRIEELAMELIDAPPLKLASLAVRLQRLRVTRILLSEVSNPGETDPSAGRELALLHKLYSDVEFDDPNANEEQALAERLAAQEAMLAERGISPASARNLARVLSTVSTKAPALDLDADDELTDGLGRALDTIRTRAGR